MVQLVIRLLAPPGDATDLVRALQSAARPAQLARGCGFAQVYRRANDDHRIEYIEEWDDAAALRRQLGTARFVGLLEALEQAAEPPFVEFRFVSEARGLEYITEAMRASDAGR